MFLFKGIVKFFKIESRYVNIYVYNNFINFSDKPTKMDNAVFNAIKNYQINMEKYPNIYRWKHSIGLYPQSEREW